MPQPTSYTCAKCDFKGSDFSTWGSYSYSAGDMLIPVSRRLALCNSCNSVVSAEVLPTRERAESIKSETLLLTKQFRDEEYKRLEALSGRTSPARCLACGSHDFEFIPHVEPDRHQKRNELPVRTGLVHKNCGGRIYAEFRAPNFFMGTKLPKKFFDTEGIEKKKP